MPRDYNGRVDKEAVKDTPPVTNEEKRFALEMVLNSDTFARSDKLKQFLRYVAEMELSGRGNEIAEHTIGVEALGRSPRYSTGDDSIVRSTAYVLRQKLQEFYDKEWAEAPVRLELPK